MKPETEAAIREFIATAEGWTTLDRLLEMADQVIQRGPKILVEIGSFSGRVTVALGLALKEIGEGKVYSLDPWKAEDAVEGEANPENVKWWSTNVDLEAMHRLTIQGIWKYGLDQFCIPIRAASQNCADLFTVIDLLYIDGNHTEVASCRDVEFYMPKLVPGGLLFFDDSDWNETQKAIKLIDGKADIYKDGGNYRIYIKR